MAKLTKTYIDKIRPGPKDEFHWDDEVKGFGVRVTPTRKITFIVQGRIAGSSAPTARITIGSLNIFTVDQARDEAREHLRTMRKGIDPRDVRKQDEAMKVTLQQVCDAYLDRPGKLKESSKAEMGRHVDRVFADWKDKPIVSITEGDVRERHRKMTTEGLRGKPAPGQANISMTTLRTLINFAARQYRRADGSPLIQRNPVDVLQDHWAKLGTRTDRYIDQRMIGEVWHQLAEARDKARTKDELAGIDLAIFLLLTGARRNEGAELTWDRVNIDDNDPANCWWYLDDRKRGDPIWLPLNSQAVALLKQRTRTNDNPHVFPSRGKAGHILDPRHPMELVSTLVGKRLSCHDLRRTFTNIAMRICLIEKFRVDLLTGHKPAQADVTARNYLDLSRLDWLQPEAQKIGDWIEQQGRLAEAKARGENVVPLRA